jgi:hypothetical protein
MEHTCSILARSVAGGGRATKEMVLRKLQDGVHEGTVCIEGLKPESVVQWMKANYTADVSTDMSRRVLKTLKESTVDTAHQFAVLHSYLESVSGVEEGGAFKVETDGEGRYVVVFMFSTFSF